MVDHPSPAGPAEPYDQVLAYLRDIPQWRLTPHQHSDLDQILDELKQALDAADALGVSQAWGDLATQSAGVVHVLPANGQRGWHVGEDEATPVDLETLERVNVLVDRIDGTLRLPLPRQAEPPSSESKPQPRWKLPWR